MRKIINAIDLFCGAGGLSTGISNACRSLDLSLNLKALNHWPLAINSHSANHPYATHYCVNVKSIDPRIIIPEGKADIMMAAPECIYFSNARGGKPINDQLRSTAWSVIDWASTLNIENILIENVREFQFWGGLGANGRPLKRKRGETYLAFIKALESLGYRVEANILNAADYGDPTSRKRLFIQAKKGRKPIVWPEPTHAQANTGNKALFNEPPLKPHRAAREIIDWSMRGKSIFNRQKPLSTKTIERIRKGLQKFCGIESVIERGNLTQPVIVELRNKMQGHSNDTPLSTISTSGEHSVVCEPFLINYYGCGQALSLNDPLDTITTKDRFALVQPIQRAGDYMLSDIYLRMLQPHELRSAMGFEDDYVLSGNRQDKIAQLGNAVPCGLSTALCKAILESKHV